MEFQCFDSSSCGYPKPSVPVLPPLTGKSLLLISQPAQPGSFRPVAGAEDALTYARGRYALLEAYRLAGVGKLGALLAPSYHCSTMLDPAIRLQADVLLYPLMPDLAPDLQALEATFNASNSPVKALLATHYFGFPQRLDELAAFCARHSITLIEDCSHALFSPLRPAGDAAMGAIGESGRYAIASPYKFYASEDGGLLWANGGAPLPVPAPRAPRPVEELKGVQGSIYRARANHAAPQHDALDDAITELRAQHTPLGSDVRKKGPLLSIYYLRSQEGLKSLACSRWIIRHTNVGRLARQRRQNYQHWVKAVADLPHCRALLPDLPADCVPYMFPLFIDHPEPHFNTLKHLGVPVWRWDDMAVSNCQVASTYRLQLLHLPCHQELSPLQMDWMTAAVSKVMLQTPVAG